MKSQLTLLMVCMLVGIQCIAQVGGIIGKVTDNTKEPIIGAFVEVSQGGVKVISTVTDEDGNYTAKPLNPGRYNLTVRHTGFMQESIKGIIVSPDKSTTVNIRMKSAIQLNEVVVREYKVPQIDPTSERKTIISEELEKMPTRNTQSLVATSPGVYKGRDKTSVNIGGARKEDAVYSVDGIRVYGSRSAPLSAPDVQSESYKHTRENGLKLVTDEPLSTMSVDVDRASYSNIRRFINNGQMPPADAVRVEEMVNYFTYKYPQPQGEDPLAIVTELTTCPWNSNRKLLHIGMQARTINTEDLPASNLVFLIDVSGSMYDANKLPLVKTSLKMLVEKLRAEDRIAIVVYAGNAGLVLPSTSGGNKNTIIRALDKLQAGGSTAGGEGIKLAYRVAQENYIRGGNNRIIMATDGDFNVGVSSENELEELITAERAKGIYLTCLGYGMGNYQDSKMELLADKGNGNYAYIDNEAEAAKTLVKEFGGTIFTLAKDVKAQIEFNPEFVKSYRLVGYENRVLNAEDFKDDKKDAGDMGSGHSVTIIYEIVAARSTGDIPLKYQQNSYPSVQSYYNNEELATIKFRYKKPNGNTSKEIVKTISPNSTAIQNASENARFASAVAMFGMLLKNSPNKGNANYGKVLALARNSSGYDRDGYRAEFMQLVNRVNKSGDVAMNKWYEEED